MSLDGITLRALTKELHEKLADGRIDKIQQPDRDTIILTIRKSGSNHKLLLSAHPQTARMCITHDNKANPLQPPLFCMVMRKHLENSKIISIIQQGFERIVHITCQGYDELGELSTRVLICEFMGKHSNLILIHPEKNIILDSSKRISLEMSQYRQILPGLPYIPPPPQDKFDLQIISKEQLIQFFIATDPNKTIKQSIMQLLSGVGPQTALEIIHRSNLDALTRIEFLGDYEYQMLWQQILWLRNLITENATTPTLVSEKGKAMAFAPFPLTQLQQFDQKSFSSMSELLEYFIGHKEKNNVFQQKSYELERLLNHETERCQKKLALQFDKVQAGAEAEHLKIWGELITANLYQLKQGFSADVINYYDPDQNIISIPMSPQLTPNENAQKYFKQYNKAKIGAEKALIQSAITEEELNYLDSIKSSFHSARLLSDLDDIRLELEAAGYAKAKLSKQNKKSKKTPAIVPLTITYEGFTILIGKNNIQNDYLTLKLAKSLDLWFHAKDIPGSHVIIRNHQEQKEVPSEILDLAAHFAAYFSKSKHSSLVPVDYTLKKYVKKPNGAKPGRVIYENQKTIYITPDEQAIETLLLQYSK